MFSTRSNSTAHDLMAKIIRFYVEIWSTGQFCKSAEVIFGDFPLNLICTPVNALKILFSARVKYLLVLVLQVIRVHRLFQDHQDRRVLQGLQVHQYHDPR